MTIRPKDGVTPDHEKKIFSHLEKYCEWWGYTVEMDGTPGRHLHIALILKSHFKGNPQENIKKKLAHNFTTEVYGFASVRCKKWFIPDPGFWERHPHAVKKVEAVQWDLYCTKECDGLIQSDPNFDPTPYLEENESDEARLAAIGAKNKNGMRVWTEKFEEYSLPSETWEDCEKSMEVLCWEHDVMKIPADNRTIETIANIYCSLHPESQRRLIIMDIKERNRKEALLRKTQTDHQVKLEKKRLRGVEHQVESEAKRACTFKSESLEHLIRQCSGPSGPGRSGSSPDKPR